jgi:hypothetical protein
MSLRKSAIFLAAILLISCNHEAPIGERAMQAYKAGDYKTALPLLKKWASTPEIASDREKLKNVMAYIVDAELKTTGKVEGVKITAATRPATNDNNLASLKAQAAALVKQTSAAPVEGLGPNGERIPHKPIPPGETRVMTIKELGNFEFDPNRDTDVPADVRALDGGKVRLRGFMLPLSQAAHVTDFALVPSLASCCFGQPPGVQHIITCRVPKSKALDFITDEINVEGIVHVKVVREDDYTSEIFSLDVTSVKLAE